MADKKVTSLYLHVPFCLHLCNYCDFYKIEYGKNEQLKEQQKNDYENFLTKSTLAHENFLTSHQFKLHELETLYLGGGTPSLWGGGAEYMEVFLREQNLLSSQQCEFTLEVDPGTWSNEFIQSWQDIGLNRISVGTQSLDETFLSILDRQHSVEQTLTFLKFLSQKKWNYSLDFLLGVPYSKEKKRDIKSELDRLLEYSPSHVSLYILNARQKYPHYHEIPDDQYIRDEYLLVSDYLTSKGFSHYEVSNFALPGFESRHNLKYWTSHSVAALGPTATGFLKISHEKAIRYKWKVSRPLFEIESLGREEMEMENLYLGLRSLAGAEVSLDLASHWRKKNYLRYQKGRHVILSSLGFLMLDSLMNDIFTHRAVNKED